MSGLPRSGTSALGSLLNLSKDVAVYMELKGPWLPYSPQVLSEDHVSKFLNDSHPHYAYNQEILEKSKEARFVGDKRPMFLGRGFARTIENFRDENLRVVHIFRNIRDIALSYQMRVEKNQNRWPQWKGIFAAAQDFNITNQFLRDAKLHESNNFMFVNYEDLFHSSALCMKIFEWIGVKDFRDGALSQAVVAFVENASCIADRERFASLDPRCWADFESRIDMTSAKEVQRLYGAKII